MTGAATFAKWSNAVPPTMRWTALAAAVGGLAALVAPGSPAPQLAALALMTVAAVEDISTRRIRNVLVGPALVLALIGAPDGGSAAAAALVAPLPFLVMALIAPRAMGMGDVKLLSPAGALVGIGHLPELWVAIALIGGALAVVASIRRGRSTTLAYGVAITAGTLVAILQPI